MEGDFLLPPPPIVVNPPKVAEEVNVKAQNSPDVGTAGAVTRAMSHGGSDSGSPDCVATGKMASHGHCWLLERCSTEHRV